MNYACANYLCSQYGCQGHCIRPPSYPPYYRPGHYSAPPRGCVCPPESEKTCQGFGCPRKGFAALAIEAAPADETAKTGSARSAKARAKGNAKKVQP